VSLKKDSLIRGTIILAAAALIARFLGIFQRVPLDYMLTEAGGAYFTAANNIYLLLLVVATAGIPSTISKMIAERHAQGRVAEARDIYRAALLFGIVTGVIVSGALFVCAPLLARDNPGAAASIRAIAPALLLFPVIAMMRGYFQGRQYMTAGGVSQIVEQILRVVTSVALAFALLSWGYGDERVAAAASAGTIFGAVGAFAVMLAYAVKLRRADAADRRHAAALGRGGRKLRYGDIYREIFRLSVPIVLTSMTVQFFYYFDTQFFYRLTESYYGTRELTNAALDILGMKAQTIAGIPPILAVALSQSIIPVISSAYATGNMREVSRQASLVLRIVIFTGVPIALALTAAAPSVTGLLYTPGGSGVVAALTAGTVLQIVMMTTNSTLFGLGKPRQAMYHTLTGMAVKAALSAAFGPALGVYGLILASTVGFLWISWFNVLSIRKVVPISVLGSRWLPYTGAVLLASAAGFGIDFAGLRLLEDLPFKLACLFTAAASCAASAAAYLVFMVLFGAVTRDDAASFPGPLKKLFAPLLRIRAR
jgi:O-antigen/teichoic acid export membrane protein